jgi:flavin reductase (DIM6/NTAB) family NADH-FMN oxidoreductase RutF
MKQSIGPNPVIHPRPVLLVATYDAGGQANVMTASWAGICCGRPPCIAVALRKATLSHENILASEAFTVAIPSARQVVEVDRVGVTSGRDIDKFELAGWTAVPSEVVNAPYVDQCPVVLECELMQTIEMGLHMQFIGEIRDVKVDTEVVGKNDLPDIEKVQPFVYATGNRAYYALGTRLREASIVREL